MYLAKGTPCRSVNLALKIEVGDLPGMKNQANAAVPVSSSVATRFKGEPTPLRYSSTHIAPEEVCSDLGHVIEDAIRELRRFVVFSEFDVLDALLGTEALQVLH